MKLFMKRAKRRQKKSSNVARAGRGGVKADSSLIVVAKVPVKTTTDDVAGANLPPSKQIMKKGKKETKISKRRKKVAEEDNVPETAAVTEETTNKSINKEKHEDDATTPEVDDVKLDDATSPEVSKADDHSSSLKMTQRQTGRRRSMSIDASTAASSTSVTDVTSPKSINTYDTIKVDNRKKPSSSSKGFRVVHKKKKTPPSPIPEVLEEIQSSEDLVPEKGQDLFSNLLPELDMCCGIVSNHAMKAKSIIEGFQHEIDRVLVVGVAKNIASAESSALNVNVDVVVDDPEPEASLLTKLLSRRRLTSEIINDESSCDDYNTVDESSTLQENETDMTYDDSYAQSLQEYATVSDATSSSVSKYESLGSADHSVQSATFSCESSHTSHDGSTVEKKHVKRTMKFMNPKRLSMPKKPPRCPSPKIEEDQVVAAPSVMRKIRTSSPKLNLPAVIKKVRSHSPKLDIPFTHAKTTSASVDNSRGSNKTATVSASVDCSEQEKGSLPSDASSKSSSKVQIVIKSAARDRASSTGSVGLRSISPSIPFRGADAESKSIRSTPARSGKKSGRLSPFDKMLAIASARSASPAIPVAPAARMVPHRQENDDVMEGAEVLKDGQLKGNTVVDLGALDASKDPSVELTVFEDEAREEEDNFPNNTVEESESREDTDLFRVTTYDLIAQAQNLLNHGDYALEIAGQ